MMIGPIQLLMGFYGRFAAGTPPLTLICNNYVPQHESLALIGWNGSHIVMSSQAAKEVCKVIQWLYYDTQASHQMTKSFTIIALRRLWANISFSIQTELVFSSIFTNISCKISTQLVFLLLTHSHPTCFPL